MAWTVPMTALDNAIFTAAQFNTHIRDNLNQTMPALATTAGRWFITSGTNALVERAISQSVVTTAETTSSNAYGDLTTPGPAVTITTGTSALVFWSAEMQSANTSNGQYMSYAVSGSTTVGASDDWALLIDGTTNGQNVHIGRFHHRKGLTPGSNVFTAKYRSETNAVSCQYWRRALCVVAF